MEPLRLKRRYEAVDGSEDDNFSSDSADSCDSVNAPSIILTPSSILRRHKVSLGRKCVRFDAVTVYYFSRKQGFTSVPSQGGSSLGMSHHHCAIRRYSLGEFAQEQESSHKLLLRQHLRQEKLNARKLKLTHNGTVQNPAAESLTLDDISDEDLDVEAVEVDDCFFLRPLSTKRRRALLRAAGIARIDAREKAELRAIRSSREECGCDCRFYCDPRRCGCSQAGIKCQVDRLSFPCGCTRDGCGNTAGRIEFNSLRVRTHYLHTIMKLDLQERSVLGSGSGDDLSEDALVEAEMVEDSLERENETAVLHLQSAEERERRRELEETLCCSAGMERVLLQGPLPEETTMLCFTERREVDEHQQMLLKEPGPVLFFQVEESQRKAETCGQGSAEMPSGGSCLDSPEV